MSTNHEAATEAITHAMAFFVHDELPEGPAREWAEAKRQELPEITADVLYGEREDGHFVMDPDYVGSFLLVIQEGLRGYKDLRQKQAFIGHMTRTYLRLPYSVSDMLDGKMGEDEQRAFLHGAIKMIEVCMQAELLQRELAETTLPETDSKF